MNKEKVHFEFKNGKVFVNLEMLFIVAHMLEIICHLIFIFVGNNFSKGSFSQQPYLFLRSAAACLFIIWPIPNVFSPVLPHGGLSPSQSIYQGPIGARFSSDFRSLECQPSCRFVETCFPSRTLLVPQLKGKFALEPSGPTLLSKVVRYILRIRGKD
jgi:hypothetical protein